MKRPLGIGAVSVFSFVGAVTAGVAAISLAFPGSPLEPMWRLNPRGHQGLARMHGWAVADMLNVVSVDLTNPRTPTWPELQLDGHDDANHVVLRHIPIAHARTHSHDAMHEHGPAQSCLASSHEPKALR